MTAMIRIGIAGYGNLGRGVEAALAQNPDMTVVGVYTRRAPEDVETVNPDTPVYSTDALATNDGSIDVLILCGGSKDDLPVQSPELASRFNIVDSFDTHARIPEHFAAVDAPARAAGTTALISAGWDPGMFSINRILGEALLSFLGLGVQPPSPSLGIMLSDAQQYIFRAPYAALFPGLAIALLCLAFNLFGDALRDAFDPQGHR